jgi:DNA-binding Xre family transcriptional regulator
MDTARRHAHDCVVCVRSVFLDRLPLRLYRLRKRSSHGHTGIPLGAAVLLYRDRKRGLGTGPARTAAGARVQSRLLHAQFQLLNLQQRPLLEGALTSIVYAKKIEIDNLRRRLQPASGSEKAELLAALEISEAELTKLEADAAGVLPPTDSSAAKQREITALQLSLKPLTSNESGVEGAQLRSRLAQAKAELRPLQGRPLTKGTVGALCFAKKAEAKALQKRLDAHTAKHSNLPTAAVEDKKARAISALELDELTAALAVATTDLFQLEKDPASVLEPPSKPVVAKQQEIAALGGSKRSTLSKRMNFLVQGFEEEYYYVSYHVKICCTHSTTHNDCTIPDALVPLRSGSL